MGKKYSEEDVKNELLKNGVRIIKINNSEKNYEYVAACLKDISKISKFHYKDKNTIQYDNCYYGFKIGKDAIYLFVDEGRKKIVAYDKKNEHIMYLEGYDVLKAAIENKSKSAIYYLERNKKILKPHIILNRLLIGACILLVVGYAQKILDDSHYSATALYLANLLGLQDCLDALLPQFDYKPNEGWCIFVIALEILIFGALIGSFMPFMRFDEISVANNILVVIVTLATIIIRNAKLKTCI